MHWIHVHCFFSWMYRQTTISAATIITKSVVRTVGIIAMGRLLGEFADVDVALQDSFTVIVSTEMVVTVAGTSFVTSPFVFWVLGHLSQLKLTVVLRQLRVGVIFTVTGINSAT